MSDIQWYNPAKALSYNAFLTFVLGGRGIGKTFSYKKLCFKNYITKGEQFIYLRRTQTELDEMDRDKFFNLDLFNAIYDDFEILSNETSRLGTVIRYYGDGAEHKLDINTKRILLDDEIMCYFKSLSTWVKLKSSEYDTVKTLLFDEVLIDISANNITYLPNEINAFFQLLSTIFRHRSGNRVFLLSNATKFNNPYFNYFKFTGDKSKRFWSLKKYGALIEFCDEVVISMDNTADIYKLTQDSEVFDSNVHNEFQEKFDSNVGKIEGPKIRLYSIYTQGTFLTVYNANNRFYVAKGYDKNVEVFTFNINDIEQGFIYLTRSDEISIHIRRNFYRGGIFYADLETKTKFANAIQKII